MRRMGSLQVVFALPLASCAALQTTSEAPAPVTVSVGVPELVSLPQTKGTQSAGGISITLAPVPFQVVRRDQCLYEAPGPSLITIVPKGASANTHTKVVETKQSSLALEPPGLKLLLTVRNQMSRVFRGAGAVVQYNLNAQAQAVAQDMYGDFINAIVPPRGEVQITIQGPSLTSLPDGATLGVFLYDVVTATDAAGNPSKKENFEWYFTVKYLQRSEQATRTRTTVWIANSDLFAAQSPEHQCVRHAAQ